KCRGEIWGYAFINRISNWLKTSGFKLHLKSTIAIVPPGCAKMKLTVKLTDQEKGRLEAIAVAMQCNQSDVVRTLINEKFDSLQFGKTLLERRGGHPKYLLDSPANLSERSNRKARKAK